MNNKNEAFSRVIIDAMLAAGIDGQLRRYISETGGRAKTPSSDHDSLC